MVTTSVFNQGDTLTIQKRVEEKDTALRYGSGKLDKLFATPSLVALMIEAGSKLLDDKLPEGYITVGKLAQVDHQKPTYLGEMVSVKVTITACDSVKVVLEMEAFDEMGLIGTGYHHRYVVNKQSLLNRAHDRETKLETHNY
jgi:predicted thioesterase